ncbi:MAG TPA: LuxR C-terminal-related transcriptional regulator [Conexibacter sp.]|nr:LuxR C-terminal-related transcriptional regulator [Conexibacter sp.]
MSAPHAHLPDPALAASLRPAWRPRLARSSPLPRPARGNVARPRLVHALLDDTQALAALVAPAGYGKSTLLAQWRDHDPRPFAWVGVTPALDDPRRLLEAVAGALCELWPLPAEAAAPEAGPDAVLRALGAQRPVVLVLDDLHLLRSRAAGAVVARLALGMPPGSTLAVGSRREPALPLGRLRAQDDVVELRAGALALTRGEASQLLLHAGLRLSADQAARLVALADGWPAALHLAIRALREQPDAAAAAADFAGDDAIVADFVLDEALAGLDDEDRGFLRRTAVLDPLRDDACDAVLATGDAGATLRRLARAGVPLQPLDRAQTVFRLHRLVAQALRGELRATEARLAPELHGRASAWHEREGELEGAVEHALAARDTDRVAALLGAHAPALVGSGRAAIVDGWLGRVGEPAAVERPTLALTAALVRVAAGERDAAECWLDHARHGALPVVGAGLSALRAALFRDGAETMAADASRAFALAGGAGPWAALACLLEGSAHALADRPDEARERLAAGARLAVLDLPLVRSLCLAQLAFLALCDGDDEESAAVAGQARAAVDRGGDGVVTLAALTYAVHALVLARRGGLDAARADIVEAKARLAALPDAAPWYGALARVALARAELQLSDAAEARRLLGEASRLLRRCGGAVGLKGWIDEGWGRADDYAAGPVACPSALTRAELRVLRLLPSHLTLPEIAARLHVSTNTIKTQAHAVYRKLDAGSRTEAVAHARAIGLVEAEFARSG